MLRVEGRLLFRLLIIRILFEFLHFERGGVFDKDIAKIRIDSCIQS